MPYLNREQILILIKNKQIYSDQKSIIHQIQPASLDLTLYHKCYRIKASFLPNNTKISKVIKELSFIYSITGHVELTKLVRELIVSGSHNDIVNLFRQNKLFMAKLSENKELLSKMTKKELMDKFVDMRSSGVPNKKVSGQFWKIG